MCSVGVSASDPRETSAKGALSKRSLPFAEREDEVRDYYNTEGARAEIPRSPIGRSHYRLISPALGIRTCVLRARTRAKVRSIQRTLLSLCCLSPESVRANFPAHPPGKSGSTAKERTEIEADSWVSAIFQDPRGYTRCMMGGLVIFQDGRVIGKIYVRRGWLVVRDDDDGEGYAARARG